MKSTLTTMTLSLTGISLVAAAILACVNALTREPIAVAAEHSRLEALKALLPPFDNDIVADSYSGENGTIVFPAFKDGKAVATAVQSGSDNAFGGHIEIITGFDSTGAVTAYRILNHAETPGLGAKADTWFAPGGKGDITGTKSTVAVKADGGQIDAISGATITSRAFLEAVNKARQDLQ